MNRLCTDMKFMISQYLSLYECTLVKPFHCVMPLKYKNLWFQLTGQSLTKQSVKDFIELNFLFGLQYQQTSDLQGLIECIIFVVGIQENQSYKIDACLHLYMGLIEVKGTPHILMFNAMSAIFQEHLVTGFKQVAIGFSNYFQQVMIHREKLVQLHLMTLLLRNDFTYESISPLAKEMNILKEMSKCYGSFYTDTKVNTL